MSEVSDKYGFGRAAEAIAIALVVLLVVATCDGGSATIAIIHAIKAP